jgi:hypothetical protein
MVGGGARPELSRMKQDAQFFEDRDPQLIYIAKRLSDATELEQVLDKSGLDYGVEADTYTGGIIFRSERVGAFFYVMPEVLEAARTVLTEHGFRPAR